MPPKHRTAFAPVALLVASAVTLAGCNTTGAGGGSGMTASRAGQGAAILGGTGAVLGALFSDNKAEGALRYGLIGALVGVGAGLLVDAQMESYASEEQRLEAMTEAARTEARKSRENVRTITAAVNRHKQTVSALQARYDRGRLPAEEVRRQLAAMQADRAKINEAYQATDRSVEALEAEIERQRRNGANTAELAQIRRQLIDDRNKLRRQLAALTESMEKTPVPMS